jgi:hypothetical protein
MMYPIPQYDSPSTKSSHIDNLVLYGGIIVLIIVLIYIYMTYQNNIKKISDNLKLQTQNVNDILNAITILQKDQSVIQNNLDTVNKTNADIQNKLNIATTQLTTATAQLATVTKQASDLQTSNSTLQDSLNKANDSVTQANNFILQYYIGSNKDLLQNLTDLRNNMGDMVKEIISQGCTTQLSNLRDNLKNKFINATDADKQKLCDPSTYNSMIYDIMSRVLPVTTNVFHFGDTISSLNPINYLTSGSYKLVMQNDGNLALYRYSDILWQSATSGSPGEYVLNMDSVNGLYIWSMSQSKIIWNNTTLLSDTGRKLVLYQGQLSIQGTNNRYMLYAPNILLYKTTLHSNNHINYLIDDTTGYKLTILNDGNLVLSDGNMKKVWSTTTTGQPGIYNLENNIYGIVVWGGPTVGPSLWANGNLIGPSVKLILKNQCLYIKGDTGTTLLYNGTNSTTPPNGWPDEFYDQIGIIEKDPTVAKSIYPISININYLITSYLTKICPGGVFNAAVASKLIDDIYNLTCKTGASNNIINKAIDYTLGSYGQLLK